MQAPCTRLLLGKALQKCIMPVIMNSSQHVHIYIAGVRSIYNNMRLGR